VFLTFLCSFTGSLGVVILHSRRWILNSACLLLTLVLGFDYILSLLLPGDSLRTWVFLGSLGFAFTGVIGGVGVGFFARLVARLTGGDPVVTVAGALAGPLIAWFPVTLLSVFLASGGFPAAIHVMLPLDLILGLSLGAILAAFASRQRGPGSGSATSVASPIQD
jgi:hypothetical protein